MDAAPYGYRLPIDISTHGYMIDRIINVLHVFMIVLFIGWFVFLLYTLVRFRARPGHKAEYAPGHTKFTSYLEVGVALFEFAILFFLAMPAWNKAKASVPDMKNAVSVRVVAEQFAWNIHYPGEDGVFGATKAALMDSENPVGLDSSDPHAKDDVVVINTLNLPVNKPIVVQLSSKDVIHSFYLPVLRVKQDAVPGMVFPVYFEATKTGDYEIACAQLCGLGHYRMRGFVKIQTEAEYAAWLKEQVAMKEEG